MKIPSATEFYQPRNSGSTRSSAEQSTHSSNSGYVEVEPVLIESSEAVDNDDSFGGLGFIFLLVVMGLVGTFFWYTGLWFGLAIIIGFCLLFK